MQENKNLSGATLNMWRDVCFENSEKAGWWKELDQMKEALPQELFEVAEKWLYATKITLLHSEASEMMEGLRKDLPDDKLPHRSMEEVEAADILIRLMDYCGKRNLDIGGAVVEKMKFNSERLDHKPEKREKQGGKKF